MKLLLKYISKLFNSLVLVFDYSEQLTLLLILIVFVFFLEKSKLKEEVNLKNVQENKPKKKSGNKKSNKKKGKRKK